MIIGNFTYNEVQDTYTGELATLEVGARKVVFRQIEAKTDKAPATTASSVRPRPAISSLAPRGKSTARRTGIPLGQARRSVDDPAGQLRAGGARRQQGIYPRVVAREPQGEGRVIRPGRLRQRAAFFAARHISQRKAAP